MKNINCLCFLALLGIASPVLSQNVGIGTNTPDAKALLDLTSNAKGILIPRLSTTQRTAIASPPPGLLVYDSTVNLFYWFDGTTWQNLPSATKTWVLNGNAGTNPTTQFIGTTDNNALSFRVNNIKAGLVDQVNKNVILGTRAALNLSALASQNTIVGDSAWYLENANVSGNTVIGYGAASQTTGPMNWSTAVGNLTGLKNTGSWVTLIGIQAGTNNQADGSVFVGSAAGLNNTTGHNNTFIGDNAGNSNRVGLFNTYVGSYTGFHNKGQNNTFMGVEAGYTSDSSNLNTFIGSFSGFNNTTGGENTFLGYSTGFNNTTGQYNIFLGSTAGTSNNSGSRNIFIGRYAGLSNNSGTGSIAIGSAALSSMSGGINQYNVAIGDSCLYSSTYSTTFGYMHNTAVGASAGRNNINGLENTFIGYQAGYANDSSIRSTYVGAFAGYSLHGSFNGYNCFFGDEAGIAMQNGGNSCFYGAWAGHSQIAGGENTFIGVQSGLFDSTGTGNTFLGAYSGQGNKTGSQNVAFGYLAAVNAPKNLNNFIAIGYNAGRSTSVSNSIELGNNTITWIGGQVGWSTFSDGRIKDNIREDVPGLEFINKLRPVTYNLNIHKQDSLTNSANSSTNNWPGKYDIEKKRVTGFIAQEVEQAALQCNYDFHGVTKPTEANGLYSLNYSEFVVPLVKAMQEQQELIKSLEKRITQLENQNKKLKHKH